MEKTAGEEETRDHKLRGNTCKFYPDLMQRDSHENVLESRNVAPMKLWVIVFEASFLKSGLALVVNSTKQLVKPAGPVNFGAIIMPLLRRRHIRDGRKERKRSFYSGRAGIGVH